MFPLNAESIIIKALQVLFGAVIKEWISLSTDCANYENDGEIVAAIAVRDQEGVQLRSNRGGRRNSSSALGGRDRRRVVTV